MECDYVQEWCSIDKDLVFPETMTDQDVIDHVTGSSVTPPPEKKEEDDDTEDAQTEAKVPTKTEAIEHLVNTILWLDAEDEADHAECSIENCHRMHTRHKHTTYA